jgi:hypothetical protein
MRTRSNRIRSLGRRLVTAISVFALVSGVALTAVLVDADAAEAADLSAFDPGLIITDDLFFDGDAMSASAIQSFLDAKAPSCVSGGGHTCIADYKASTNTRTANANCAAISGRSNQSAATIIATVGLACDVSPKVILVTLQKEQGLITAGPKSSSAYRIAMGYGCPDTAACDTKYYGFFNQVYSAAWQFQQYTHSSSFNYHPGRINTIKYHPNSGCGTVQVYIRNQATAGLYNYTPYVPNSAALAAGYGLGNSCSSYGNRNFFNYFSDWFGNPANALKNASFQKGTSNWKSGGGTVSHKGYTDKSKAQSGSRYATVSSTVAGRSFQQSISRDPKPGQIWAGSVWLRAANEGETSAGALIVSTVGGTTESISVPFDVGAEWTEVSAELGVERTGHTGMRLSVRLDSAGTKTRVDTTALYVSSVQEPRVALKVEQTYVGSGANGGWVRSAGSVVVKKGWAVGPLEGKYYVKASSSTAGPNLYQRIPRVTAAGTAYTATAWVRSGKAGEEYTGRFVLQGMGGSAEATTTDFVAGDEWTPVAVTLDIEKPSHKSLRPKFYLDTPGIELLFDKIVVTPNLLTRDPSFESGTSGLNALPAGTTATRVANDEFAGQGLQGRAIDGQSVLRMTSTATDSSYLRMDRNRVLTVGASYTSSVWVRSAVPGEESTVRLVLSGMTSTPSESTEAEYTVTDEWQLITVTHKIEGAGLTRLRTDLRLDTAGADILVDGALLH